MRAVQHVFLAFTNPVAGAEANFNAWYNRSHVPEVLRYGRGFVGCRRYKFQGERGDDHPRHWDYLALYFLECDDLLSLSTNTWIEGAPPLTPFRGLLKDDHVAWVYTPCTPRVSRSQRSSYSMLPFADSLRLQWRGVHIPNYEPELAELVRSEACIAATAFGLADSQRRNQQSSPWQSLVICEMTAPDSALRFTCDVEWSYVAVGGYVTLAGAVEALAV